jgi:4-hydroxy-tetrahydrodipicolinate reductase
MRTADQPIRITLFAPNRRMGKAIAAAVAEEPGFALDQDHGDVLVDFSAPAARILVGKPAGHDSMRDFIGQ